MAFGSGAKYYEAPALIPAGEYRAKITKIEEVMLKGKSALEVKLDIQGYEDAKPNVYRLFDVDKMDSSKQQEWTSKRISRFCDATGAQLTQNGLIYRGIIGKNVKAIIEKRDNGFMDVVRLEALDGEVKQQDMNENNIPF